MVNTKGLAMKKKTKTDSLNGQDSGMLLNALATAFADHAAAHQRLLEVMNAYLEQEGMEMPEARVVG
jgi:hypothetical protein